MGKKKETFATSIYKRFRGVTCSSYLIDMMVVIISSIVIAQCVSPEALAAVSIVAPLQSVVLFVTIVLADATSNRVQLELGEFQKDRAACVLMKGIQYAIVAGIVMLIGMLFGKDLYFRFMNVSEATAEYAREYLKFYQFSYALFPLNATLEFLIADSANVKLIYSKRIISLVCNTVLAVIFTKLFGIAGVGLAHLIANVTNIIVMSTHFNSIYAAVKPKWMKMELIYYKALKGAVAGGTQQIAAALASVVINKIVIETMGEKADTYLSILGIVSSVMLLEFVYEALIQTARSQLDIYSVERNYKTAKVLMKEAMRDMLIAGIALALIYILAAPLVPRIYNITDPEFAEKCILAVRLSGAFTIFYAAYVAFRFIQQGLQHFVVVAVSIVIQEFVVYIIIVKLCTSILPESVLWIALGKRSIISLGIIALLAWLDTAKHKNRSFPWLIDTSIPQPAVYNVDLTKETVIEVRDAVSEEMEKAGVDARTKYQMELVIEEFGMLVAEKNKDSKKVLSEWDVWIDKNAVTMIVRDNGKALDFSDEDNSTGSLGAYFLSCLMPNIGQVNYATAVSMNRHRFQVVRTQKETVE